MNTKNTITSRKLAACSALALSLTVFTARAQEAADPAAAQQSGAVQSQQKSPIELSIEQRLENLIVGSLDGAEGEDGKRRMQLFLRAPNLPEGTDVKSLMALPLTQQDATAWIIGPDGRVRQQQLQPGDLAPNNYRIVPNQIAGSPFYIGVVVDEVPEVLRNHVGLDGGSGVLVKEVLPDSPSEKAGIRQHDIITKAGGQAIKNNDDLVAAIQNAKGKELSIDLVRKGEAKTVSLKPARRQLPQITSHPFVPLENDLSTKKLLDAIRGSQSPGAGVIELREEIAELQKAVSENQKLLKQIAKQLRNLESGEGGD